MFVDIPSEATEGPYYTQLGAARDIPGVREILEQRLYMCLCCCCKTSVNSVVHSFMAWRNRAGNDYNVGPS